MGEDDDEALLRWLNLTWFWALFGQRQVRSGPRVICEIGTKNSHQVALVEDNHVLEYEGHVEDSEARRECAGHPSQCFLGTCAE